MSFRRALRVRPVKSEKEEVTWSNLGINAATAVSIDLIFAVDSPTTAGQVEIGDTVKNIFLEMNFSAETVTSTKIIHWAIYKLPAGGTAILPSTYDSAQKKQILKRGMEMVPKDVNTIIKKIVSLRIPPRLSRFGDSDRLRVVIQASSTESINWCGICIYKHFG